MMVFSAEKREKWLPLFFGIAACSWVPHWSCHYYRIETDSSFIVGDIHYSMPGSALAMIFYSVLIVINLLSVSFPRLRFISAFSSGILHMAIGVVHVIRFIDPFHFEIFGYEWPINASLRELLVVFPLGIICLTVAFSILAQKNELRRPVTNFVP